MPALEKKPYRPPFWQSKVYGEPYGDFNRQPKPQAVVRVEKPAAGGRAANARADLNNKLRPTSARDPSNRPRAAAAASRPKSAAVGRPTQDRATGAAGAAYNHNLAIGGKLQDLEDKMRSRLKQLRSLHAGEKAILLGAFHKVDLERAGKISPAQFIAAWKRLSVAVTMEEAMAAFNKYGQTRDGYLPYPVFVEALLVGRNRLVGMASDIRKGAFIAGKSADFQGKIVYPPCRKGVFTPSGWDGSAAKRSAAVPDAQLELTFVHGYGRDCNANNLFYTSTGEVVYYTAGLGIVYDKAAHTQRFFTGHDDDVKCLTISRARDLVATGQVGRTPHVCVWDPATCRQHARLQHPAVRGITAVGFCRDAKLLAAVGMDNNHTIFVWDWRKNKILAELKGHTDVPPKVYGVVFDPFGPDHTTFLSYGVNHIKWWTKQGQSYVEASGSFGAASKHTVMSAVWLPSGKVLTGMPGGEIAVWSRERKCVRVVRAHAAGPQVLREDGPPTHHGVRCLRLREDMKTLLSAGADGHVIRWDVSGGDLKEGSVMGATPVKSPYQGAVTGPNGPTAPVFRGLDCMPGSDVFIAGTHRSDIWEIDDTPEVLIYGHSADLYGVAWDPTNPTLFATASEGENVFVWCAARRRLLRMVALGNKGRCVHFSPDGKHLAVGCKHGGLHVLDARSLQRVHWTKTFDTAVSDVKFSPDGRLLAACSNDQFIDIFDRVQGYKKIARCAGHSSTVRHVDWSVDSSVIRTMCSAYEILYFSPRTGKQVVQNQRDTEWSTWTGVLGFHVMGIWPDGSDGTDINACDRSGSGRHLVTADDFGGVNLFNYPCVVQDAPCWRGGGHSSHVMNARFSPDDNWVVSVGGKDRAVFQWRFRTLVKPPPQGPVPPWEVEPAQGGNGKKAIGAPGSGAGPWETPPAMKRGAHK